MKPAIIVVDMVQDNFHDEDRLPITAQARVMIPALNRLLKESRIATHFCVLTTALDALCHDFRAVILEDCSAAPTPEMGQRTLDNYRRNPLYPLLRVMKSEAFLGEF